MKKLILISSLIILSLGIQHSNAQQRLFAGKVTNYSTQYDVYPNGWSNYQILGLPNVYPSYGDIAEAYNPSGFGAQRDFIDLEFDNNGPIDSIFIYETFTPGYVDSVFVKNPLTQNWDLVYGSIAAPAPASARIFAIGFPMTTYNVREVRLCLANDTASDWIEIDAVAISPAAINNFNPETTPGTSYNFDGVNDVYHTYSSILNLIKPDQATFTAWVNIHQDSATVTTDVYNGAPVLCDGDGTYFGIYLANKYGIDSLYFYNYDGADQYIGMDYTPDTWFHVAWVHSGGILKCYKNGVLYGAIASGNTTNLGIRALEMGFNLASGEYFEGEIDEVTSFNRGLSTTEINDVMQMNVPGNMNGLTGYWQMSNCDFQSFFNPNNHIADSIDGVSCTISGIPNFAGIESENINEEVKIYPNPSTELIHVSLSNNNIEFVAIYDVMGKLIFNQSFLAPSYPIISVENFPSGIYSIQIMDFNKKMYTSRFIKN